MSGLISQYGVQTKRTILVSELIRMGIKFPNVQRDVMDEHVAEIVDYQNSMFKTKGYYSFLGCLEICHLGDKYYCIDGQHRFFAMEHLYKENRLYDWFVDIEIIECQGEAEMIMYFQIINKNHPVPDFLKKIEDVDSAARIKAIRDYITNNYPGYISKSNQPQRPNINLDIFMNEMDKKYKLSNFETFNDFIQWFECENTEHKKLLEAKYSTTEGVAKYLEKIELSTKTRNGRKFYLGLYWLDNPKNKLTAKTRHKVWKTWYAEQPPEDKSPSGEILCPCCEETFISAFNFEAGHRRSFKNGGNDDISNLIPICSVCNRSMGIMDYDEYKKTL